MSKLINIAVVYLGCTLTTAVSADTLQSVMARMQPKQAIMIKYQEMRTLSLLTDPWKGSGYFYALLPDLLLKEQLTPDQELMGIKGMQLYYYNASKQQRHQGQLEDENASDMHLAAFKGLMQGNLDYLSSRYRVDFSSSTAGWHLVLTPKSNDASDNDVKITLQGLPEKVANTLTVQFADGDRTDYALMPGESGEAVQAKIQKLFSQVKGGD